MSEGKRLMLEAACLAALVAAAIAISGLALDQINWWSSVILPLFAGIGMASTAIRVLMLWMPPPA